MNDHRLTWHHVALAGFGALVFGYLIHVCMWLIDSHGASISILAIPISTVLIGGSTAAATYMRGYVTGLMKMPPAPEGYDYQLHPSISPPTAPSILRGQVPFTGASMSAISISRIEPAEIYEPETTPETPAAKKDASQ